jgi:predicted TPR repeat methyltransferase
LELIAWVIDDSARSRRAGALILIIGACVGGIVFVIQLRPERWAYVTGVAISIFAIAQAARRGKYDSLLRDLTIMGDAKENLDSDPSK